MFLFISRVTKWLIFQNPVTYIYIKVIQPANFGLVLKLYNYLIKWYKELLSSSLHIWLLTNLQWLLVATTTSRSSVSWSLTCVDKELQYKDIVTLSLMEEDGWLFRGGKMALKISIDSGGSMRWDLVTWAENSGMGWKLSIVWPIKDSGNYTYWLQVCYWYKTLSVLQELQGVIILKPFFHLDKML